MTTADFEALFSSGFNGIAGSGRRGRASPQPGLAVADAGPRTCPAPTFNRNLLWVILLVAESDQRVDPRRAAGRQVAGQ